MAKYYVTQLEDGSFEVAASIQFSPKEPPVVMRQVVSRQDLKKEALALAAQVATMRANVKAAKRPVL
jgi:hypothetical protein